MSKEPFIIRFKRLHEDAMLPSRAHPGDAGVDLLAYFSVEETFTVIQPGERKLIKTGVAIELPAGYEAQVSDGRCMLRVDGESTVGRLPGQPESLLGRPVPASGLGGVYPRQLAPCPGVVRLDFQGGLEDFDGFPESLRRALTAQLLASEEQRISLRIRGFHLGNLP